MHMLKQISKRNKKLMRNSQRHRRQETVEFRRVEQCELNRRQSKGIVNSRTIKRLQIKILYVLPAPGTYFTFCVS